MLGSSFAPTISPSSASPPPSSPEDRGSPSVPVLASWWKRCLRKLRARTAEAAGPKGDGVESGEVGGPRGSLHVEDTESGGGSLPADPNCGSLKDREPGDGEVEALDPLKAAAEFERSDRNLSKNAVVGRVDDDGGVSGEAGTITALVLSRKKGGELGQAGEDGSTPTSRGGDPTESSSVCGGEGELSGSQVGSSSAVAASFRMAGMEDTEGSLSFDSALGTILLPFLPSSGAPSPGGESVEELSLSWSVRRIVPSVAGRSSEFDETTGSARAVLSADARISLKSSKLGREGTGRVAVGAGGGNARRPGAERVQPIESGSRP